MASSDGASRQREAQEQAHEQLQRAFNLHVQNYPINLQFPAQVLNSNPQKLLKTDKDLVQHRLLEAGVLFDEGGDLQTTGQVTEAVDKFVKNMSHTGCFNAVQVNIGNATVNKAEDTDETTSNNSETLQVVLDEKNWYRLYVGGGLKHEGIVGSSQQGGSGDSLVPKVQFETSASLLNLTGHVDMTQLQYCVDQTSAATLSFLHERPLYSYLPKHGPLYTSLLTMDKGSQVSLAFRGVLDTLDYEWTRSCKDYQRLVGMRLANVSNVPRAEMATGGYSGLDWSLLFRDVIPRRHASLPYAANASPEVVSQSGPSLLHSLSYEYRLNGSLCNDRYNPTEGMDLFAKLQVAGPPGDVGFVKAQGGMSYHSTVLPSSGLALHASLQSGILKSVTFGGLCQPPSLSDRFYVGGPLQLRGFCPAGIGPRAKTGGSSTPGGDSLGGDFFYTGTLAASIPFPAIPFLQNNGVRLFGFANMGTLTALESTVPLLSVAKSTRASLGGGVSVGTAFGRLEATYAVPLRYGPRDARRSVQFGLGFSFG